MCVHTSELAVKRSRADGQHLHIRPVSIYAVMRLDVSVNHIRLLPSRKYLGCQLAFCQCSHWLLPTFHYAKCGFFLHARRWVFYKDGGQQTHAGSVLACQPRTESVPSQLLIVNRFFKSLWQGGLQKQTTTSSSILLLQFQWFDKAEDKASEISLAEGRRTSRRFKSAVGKIPRWLA